MKQGISIVLFFILTVSVYGQDTGKRLTGKVTFKASENIYVRFGDTESIAIGDTLYFDQLGVLTPCMTVTQKSSSSCICKKLNDCAVEVDEQIIFKKHIPPTPLEPTETDALTDELIDVPVNVIDSVETSIESPQFSQRIRARASAATYSNLSNEENSDRHRTMLRFSLDADHINDSRVSFEAFVNYRKNYIQQEVPSDYQTSFLNIYNLAATIDIDSTMAISIGRKINRRISSVGPIDGIQVEKHFQNFYVGGVAGFKPDISQFGFNENLYEFGGYLGHLTTGKNVYSMTTFGMLEQHNGGPIDRRYAYLQHSSTLFRNVNFFTSAEVDIYDKVNEIISNRPRLTNLFVSARYRISRKLSLAVSYDARKRIIYYETLRTDVERLLADDEERRGLRGRINVRPLKYINASISYSKRFQSDNQNKSDNINVMLSHSRVPIVRGRLSVSYNQNKSNYLTSKILSLRYSKELIKRYLQGDFYYRNVKYVYGADDFDNAQSYYGANFSLRLSKSLRLSILGELSTRNTEERIRINTKLIKRFKS